MSLLAANGVGLTLTGREVLAGIDLAAEAGRTTALIGPNGAGKTSLLRCLAGLARPSAGAVDFAGQALADWPRRELARRLAFLPQENAVAWPIAVQDLAMLGRAPHRAPGLAPPSAADRAAVADALATVGLRDLADRPATRLSGGELRRALIARALAGQPEALLADEPTASLDPGAALDVMSALKDAAAAGAAVIVATHDLELAGRFADAILLLESGRCVAAGPPSEVLTPGNLARCYGVRPATGASFHLGPLERLDGGSDMAGA